jgi:hypothetical protein
VTNIKSYKCPNDKCAYHLKMKKKGMKNKRLTLFKGVIVGESYVVSQCPECGAKVYANIEDNSNEVDNKPQSVLDLLKNARPAQQDADR